MDKLTTDRIKELIQQEEDEIQINAFLRKYRIDPENDLVYQVFKRLVDDGEFKRVKRGWYRKIEHIKPILWWEMEEREPLKITFPYDIEDNTTFEALNDVEVLDGDTILVDGLTNWGKTAWVRNLMVNNLDLFPATRLMVNEYKPTRFKRRMKHFDWVDYWNEEKPRFEVLPVTKNFEDYIIPNAMNIIDWVLLRKDFWEIAGLIEDMQMKLGGEGLLVVVLQRMPGHPEPMGGGWGAVLPALHITLDRPFKMTIRKVKSYKGSSNPEGKVYAFDIVDAGSKFRNIREVKNCPVCNSTGYKYGAKCKTCFGKGYIEID